jgi:heterodisulfide reductase subunit B
LKENKGVKEKINKLQKKEGWKLTMKEGTVFEI